MDGEEHPDVALLRRALEGDRRARQKLVERVGPLIEARVLRSVSEHKRIGINGFDDIGQQVWLRLLDRDGRCLQDFDPKRGSLEGYVSRISERVLGDVLRQRGLRFDVALLQEDQLEDPAPSPEDRAALRQLAKRLRAHLDAELPLKGRLVLRLLFDDARSEAEAAEIMGVSKQVVANWKHKIKTLALEFRKKLG